MKSFKDIAKEFQIQESPVGVVGRTSNAEAQDHISTNGLEKEFAKIVQKLGGKTAARLLLANMNSQGKIVTIDDDGNRVTEKKESIESYLRDSGFKIKLETPTKKGKELQFFKKDSAEAAFEDLKSAGFGQDYDINLEHDVIVYSEK